MPTTTKKKPRKIERIKSGMVYRKVPIKREAIDPESRTVELSFSSEAPVERYDFWEGEVFNEVLDHSPESVRMERLESGAALLVGHNTDDQVGVIEKSEIGNDRKGRALVRFGKSARAEEIFQDVLDGIRRNVSVGYVIHEMTEEETEGEGDEEIKTYRAFDWEPYEVSIVPVAADISVGVGRKQSAPMNHETKISTLTKGDNMAEKKDKTITTNETPVAVVETPPVDHARELEKIRKTEAVRVQEIRAIGKAHGVDDLADQYINSGADVNEFRKAVLESRYNAKPVETSAEIGMSPKDLKRYSLLSAIRKAAEGPTAWDGIEREASEAVAKLTKRTPKGFFIPEDVLGERRRDLSAGVATEGGYTVGTQVLASNMIELLRNKMVLAGLGARPLTGLVGNIAIPKVSGGGTAYWLAETATVTKSSQAFGQLALIAKRLSGDTAYSKELVMQSSISVENFVREDLMRVLAIEKDRAGITGLGAAGEPLGLMNETGIGAVTFGGAATWAKVVEFETDVAAANAELGSLAYLTDAAVRGKWKTVVKESGQAVYLWGDGPNPVNGYRAEVSQQVPGNKVIFGNFNDLIIADWAGLDVVVDPYSLKKSGQIEITITQWTDIGVRHAASFSVSTDAGNQ